MSWAYTREKFGVSYIMDGDDFNANIAAFARETDGQLNEQNFTRGALGYAMENNQTADDLILRVTDRKESVDPQGSTGAMTALQQTPSWTAVLGTQRIFTSTGGKVLVICSFQLECPGFPLLQSGLNFALEVDGTVMANSIIGTGDHGNELLNTVVPPLGGLGLPDFTFTSAPGVRANHVRLLCKATTVLSPGEHVFRLVHRNLFVNGGITAQFISQREMIVLNGWC